MEHTEAIQLGEPHGDPPAATKQKRKPVRRDPEKRRLQNIQAQKKYREKVKKRLGDLEALVATVAQNTEDTPPALSEDSSPPVQVDRIQPPTAQVEEAWEDNFRPHRPFQAPSISKCTSRFAIWPYDPVPTETAESEPDLFALWDPTTVVDPTNVILPRKQDTMVEWKRCFRHYIDCGCDVHHVEVQRRIPSGNESLHFLDVDQQQQQQQLMRPVSSDPYANQITLQKECMIAAMWSNCLQIGISDLAFCEEDSQSQFYREASDLSYTAVGFPSNNKTTTGVASDSMVRTVQSLFKTLKPDLRPTREQVIVPHHPFFDIFPFPTFRRNILRSETLIDEEELFYDILHGLICWGSAGIGKRERNSATGHLSSGTPWDSRSWEAKPWFLRKYWKLLGGEEGELVRQSEWWRMVRGEQEDLWPQNLVAEM